MRHLGSLVLSLALAPAIWLLTGIGLAESHRSRAVFGPEMRIELLLGLAALVGAGALLTVLVMPRLSPVGPALTGLAFLGMTIWGVVDPASLYRTLPDTFLGADDALTIPALGYAALLAVPLLATVVSPRRWRGHDQPAAHPAGQPHLPAGHPLSPITGPDHGPQANPGPAGDQPAIWVPAAVAPQDEQLTVRLSTPAIATPRPTDPQPTDSEPTTRLMPPASPDPTEETTRITLPSPRSGSIGAAPHPSAAPADPTEETTQIISSPAAPAADVGTVGAAGPTDEETLSLPNTPPAYPLPGHAVPTAPPVDPDVTRRL